MLVLSRKKDQEVCLPGLGVNIKVLQISGNAVRLGFEAPQEVHVLRGELNEFRKGFPGDVTIPMDAETTFAGQLT